MELLHTQEVRGFASSEERCCTHTTTTQDEFGPAHTPQHECTFWRESAEASLLRAAREVEKARGPIPERAIAAVAEAAAEISSLRGSFPRLVRLLLEAANQDAGLRRQLVRAAPATLELLLGLGGVAVELIQLRESGEGASGRYSTPQSTESNIAN